MRRTRLSTGLALVMAALVIMSGCKETVPETSSEEEAVVSETAAADVSAEESSSSESAGSAEENETEFETDASEKTETESAENTESVEITESAQTVESTSEETEASEEPDTLPMKSHEGEAVSFGHYVDERIAEVNSRTLSAPESGLFDVLSGAAFTAEKIRSMMESYVFPETAYLGDEVRTEERTAEIAANRNLEALTEESFAVRYALLSDNADVRGFPTMLRAVNTPEPEAFDLLQESMFSIGEGVLVLHESADGAFLFVQGNNYFGWIQAEKAALCTAEEFTDYLTREHFLVVLRQRLIQNDQAFRLATVLPYTKKTEEGYQVLLPGRREDGSLELREVPFTGKSEFVSDGFLPYDVEDLTNRSYTLTGFPYGWGDTDMNFDCSSLAGRLYQCYGIRFPRNTSAMKYYDFGGSFSVPVEGMTEEEKLDLLSGHPGAVLVMPGHAMIYGGVVVGEDGTRNPYAVQAVTAYYDSDHVLHEVYASLGSELNILHGSDGQTFLSKVHTILFYQ